MSRSPLPSPGPPTVGAVVAGLVLFALGLMVAGRVLPEWQVNDLPDRELFVERAEELAAELGLVSPAGPGAVEGDGRLVPRLSHAWGGNLWSNPYRAYGPRGGEVMVEEERPVHVRVEGLRRIPDWGDIELQAELGLDSRVRLVSFDRPLDFGQVFRVATLEPPPVPEPGRAFDDAAAAVELPAEGDGCCVPIPGVEPPEFLEVEHDPGEGSLIRRPGSAAVASGSPRPWWGGRGFRFLFWLALLAGTGVLAFILALKRRIDLRAALTLALVPVAVDCVLWLLTDRGRGLPLFVFLPVLGVLGAIVFLGWAAAESWLGDLQASARRRERRSSRELAALVLGRLDRGVGRALAFGLGVGAAAAGVGLLLVSAGVVSGWFLPARPTVASPTVPVVHGPLDLALVQAVVVLLAWAVATYVLPPRGRFLGASTLAAVGLALFEWNLLSFAADFALAFLFALFLSWAFRQAGSLGLLAAAVAAGLLPVAAFALQAPSWMPVGLALGAGVPAVLGLVATFASRSARRTEVPPPAFLERLDRERRIAYEMDLLERMQRGLLPAAPPRVVGWDFAARSMTAHRVGGDFYDFFESTDGHLWIAVGDVAGHGSSCSLGHAMTKAALASLIRAGRTPGDVLGRLDRVLRELYGPRFFTALALVRLDPATGSALYANAGFPYLFVVAGDGAMPEQSVPDQEAERVTEVELPGLPVGGGPERSYRDVELLVEPGCALVFCSDGLFEALGSPETAEPDAPDRPYGFTRPRRELEASRRSSAAGLMEEILDDWRRFVRRERPEDDTTALVVRRDGRAA